MNQFNIPIAEDWCNKEQFQQAELESKKKYIHIKPEYVKLSFKDGMPNLISHYKNIWSIRPIIREVYNNWLDQALSENEIFY